MTIQQQRLTNRIILLFILLLAAYLHLWRLTQFPPSIAGDEAKNGQEVVLLLLNPKLIVYAPSNVGREALFHYMLMLPTLIFGPNIFALRIIPALLSWLIVPLTYRWTRLLLPASPHTRTVALLASLFIAISFWNIQLSRLGLRGILLVPCMVAAYCFFWQGYRNERYRPFIYSGLFLGLTVHTYTASRSLPLAFIALPLCLTICYRHLGRLQLVWIGLIITGLVSLLVFAPLGWYFINHPQAFLFRSEQVSLETTYQIHHAHTGQTFRQFLWMTWRDNLTWFLQLSTPWQHNQDFPGWLRLIPFLFWFGFFRAIYLARRQPGYAFLLLTFALGLLPIFIGLPTTMRVILAMPATYILLAIGAAYPLHLLLERGPTGFKARAGWLTTAWVSLIVLISLLSTGRYFQFERWVGPPPLPTLVDHAFEVAAQRIRRLVLDEKQSVLVPEAVYGFPPAQFTLLDDFAPPVPATSPAQLATSDPVAIFWPADWSAWFGDYVPSFMLLSPAAEGRRGYTETIGQWEQEDFAEFETWVAEQIASDQPEIVLDQTGRPIGYILQRDRAQIEPNLRSTPQYPVALNFGDELHLKGYDIWFPADDQLDVGFFWEAQQDILEDHHLVLQLMDHQGQIVSEQLGRFDNTTASWYPGQLVINHQLLDLPAPLSPGLYTLKLGLIKANYKEIVRGKGGQWLAATNEAGILLSPPLMPLGTFSVGQVPTFPDDLQVDFANAISLTGYQLLPGDSPLQFQVWLRWQTSQPIQPDYTITIQLLDQDQRLVAQVDKQPLGGGYPTPAWLPQQPVIDRADLSLPTDLPPGSYQLAVGLYDLATLQRLSIVAANVELGGGNLAVMETINLQLQ